MRIFPASFLLNVDFPVRLLSTQFYWLKHIYCTGCQAQILTCEISENEVLPSFCKWANRRREAKCLAWGHIAKRWQGWGLNPGFLALWLLSRFFFFFLSLAASFKCFNWRIVDLQYYVRFRFAAEWLCFYRLYSILGYFKIMATIPCAIEYILVAYLFYTW